MNPNARCANHDLRPAAGQCVTCSRAFCRECVTEHGDRLICAACLRSLKDVGARKSGWRRSLALPAMCATALLGSWLFFYCVEITLEQSTVPAATQKAAR